MQNRKIAKMALVSTTTGLLFGTVMAQFGGGSSFFICKDECNTYHGCPNGYGSLAAERPICYAGVLSKSETAPGFCVEGRWNMYYCLPNSENLGVGNKYDLSTYLGSYCMPSNYAACTPFDE